VALFGPTDPGKTGPLSALGRVIRGSAPCSPCYLRRCPKRLECFDEVTVERVEEACCSLLEEGRGA
jgi:ADP-heptose:LPS heptosyltransferase